MENHQESAPRITVLPWDFNLVKTARMWTMPLGKVKKYFPHARWTELSDDEVILVDKPQYIEFRNFITRKVVRRRLLTAIASREGKFFHSLTLYM